jgi:Na+/phosphate symporter
LFVNLFFYAAYVIINIGKSFNSLLQTMTFGNIAQFLGWLGLFMLWIIFFDESSRKVVSGGIKKAIKKATNSIFKSLWIWFLATLLFQWSSAVLLILESFVSAWMIEFSHAVKVILW